MRRIKDVGPVTSTKSRKKTHTKEAILLMRSMPFRGPRKEVKEYTMAIKTTTPIWITGVTGRPKSFVRPPVASGTANPREELNAPSIPKITKKSMIFPMAVLCLTFSPSMAQQTALVWKDGSLRT